MIAMAAPKAGNLKEAYRFCDVKPLTPAQQSYYVPFAARQDAVLSVHTTLDLLDVGARRV